MILKFIETNRGFHLAEFEDLYGQKCSIQESSLATEPAVWLGVYTDLNGKDSSRMHLSQDMAKTLVEALNRFIETGTFP